MFKVQCSKFCLLFIYLLKKSRDLGSLACRLTQWTGKSRYPIHPKHLVQIEPPWYLEGIQAGDRVLALGCGNGQHVFKAAQKAKEVVGLDKDEKQLAIAQSLAEEKEVGKVKFLRADLEKGIKFKDNSFDKILALDVLEHLENRNQFLKEVKRLVKPGGLIFLAIPNRNTSWKKRQKRAGLNSYTDPDHKIEYSLGEIKKLLKDQGFKILSLEPIVYDTPWAGLIDLLGGFSLKLYRRLILWKKDKVENNIKESIGFRIKMCQLNTFSKHFFPDRQEKTDPGSE